MVSTAGDSNDPCGDKDSPGGLKGSDFMPTATEIASAFTTTCRCCRTIKGVGLQNSGVLKKIESNVTGCMARNNKEVQLRDFLSQIKVVNCPVSHSVCRVSALGHGNW